LLQQEVAPIGLTHGVQSPRSRNSANVSPTRKPHIPHPCF